MAKKQKKEKVEVSFNTEIIDMSKLQELVKNKDYEILGATIKDAFCTYSIRVTEGHNLGEAGTLTGPLIIHDDLRRALARLRVHLAVIDEAFNLSLVEIQNIDNEHEHDIVQNYDVTGFKIKGADENIQVMIIGSKYLTTVSGRMSCTTPYILLAAGTDYKWYNELLTDIEIVRHEVAMYKEGKGTRPEKDDPKPNKKQLKLTDPDQILEPAENIEE